MALAPIVFAAIGLAACTAGADSETLPSAEVTMLSTNTVTDLADIDRPAVINAWATTCPPCVREMPALQEVADERTDIAFYGLNIAESKPTVLTFLDRVQVDYGQLLDPKGYASEALGIDAMPTTFVVGADGTITARHRGEITSDQLRELLPASTADAATAKS